MSMRLTHVSPLNLMLYSWNGSSDEKWKSISNPSHEIWCPLTENLRVCVDCDGAGSPPGLLSLPLRAGLPYLFNQITHNYIISHYIMMLFFIFQNFCNPALHYIYKQLLLFRFGMRIDYSLGLSFLWVIKLSSLGPIFEATSVKSSLV